MISRNIVISILIIIILFSCSKSKEETPKDEKANLHANCTEPVTIGKQVWMCKNLDVEVYRNGDTIPHVKDSKEWSKLTTGAWCYYDNDPKMGAIYGKLYNWYAVNDPRGLAPEGWHVPSQAEWAELITFLGGERIAGGKLKEAGNSHWNDKNTQGTLEIASNETRFTALPGGARSSIAGDFDFLDPAVPSLYGIWCGFWTTTEFDSLKAQQIRLDNTYNSISDIETTKASGASVRCVKD